ncbi:MAG: SH3 domain-containing protein, partial [Clostridiales bacterium]|nr:SH3 domain-containing protein [Clostridiales bacterium]
YDSETVQPETESEVQPAAEPETESEVVDTTEYRWTTTSVNFRTEANTDCDIIETLAAGTKVEFISESDGWAQVMYNDQTGYLSTDYLTDVDPDAAASESADSEAQ